MAYEFEGVQYGKLRDMQEARRARYVQLLEEGLNFTQAAHAVGVSKRTGKVWRNGRTRSNGRNERPLVDWYGGRVKDSTTTVSSRYLSIDERIEIADLSRSGTSVRGIARRLGRSASISWRHRAGPVPSGARSGPEPTCTHMWPQGSGGTGAPSRSATASYASTPIMTICEHATRPSIRPSTSSRAANCAGRSATP